MPQREVHHADALEWLPRQGVLSGASLVTSLPDISGLPELSLVEWKSWFQRAAAHVLRATPGDGVTVFFQSDIKHEGTWVDKSYLCHRAADESGCALLWHKIVCRKPPGQVGFGRPAYSHMLCYSRGVRDDVAHSTADVMPEAGFMPWSQAMGVRACLAACRYVQRHTESVRIVDPFCGVGTVLAVANQLGLDAVGVDSSKRRVRRARTLTLPDDVARAGGRP